MEITYYNWKIVSDRPLRAYCVLIGLFNPLDDVKLRVARLYETLTQNSLTSTHENYTYIYENCN